MKNRLEILRLEIDRLIYEKQPGDRRYFISHLYGVSSFCSLLALRRSLNAELAATCGMLHDIYQITAGVMKDHAIKGAEVAKTLLKTVKLYNDAEIETITTAISRHSAKKKVHEPYDEVLKDADVMDHCLHNPDFPVLEKEIARYKNLLLELGVFH